MIWMHGLGADASDMAGLARALSFSEDKVHHVFLQAPERPVFINGGFVMPAWYDITGENLTDRQDESGINASSAIINEEISKQMKQGFASSQIVLAGFSQGGAMALYTGLTCNEPLAGILSMSGYLPLIASIKSTQSTTVPIMMTRGTQDDVVLPIWTEESISFMQSLGYKNIQAKSYTMGHAVSIDSLKDISAWLSSLLRDDL